MKREKLRAAVEVYKGKDDVYRFELAENLKSKQIVNAIKNYANGVRPEAVVALFDTTILGNGKAGFLLTEDKLYESKKKKSCDIDGLVFYKKLDDDRILLQYEDGREQEFYINMYKEIEPFIQKLTSMGRKAAKERREAELEAELEAEEALYETETEWPYENVSKESDIWNENVPGEASAEQWNQAVRRVVSVPEAVNEKRAEDETAWEAEVKRCAEETRKAEEKWKVAEAKVEVAKQFAEAARRRAEEARRVAEEIRREEEAAREAEKNRRVEELIRTGKEQAQAEKAEFEAKEKCHTKENVRIRAEIMREEEPWRSIKAEMMRRNQLGYVDVRNIVPGMVIRYEEEKYLVIAVERDEGEEDYLYDTLYLINITYEGTLMSAGKCDPVASDGCQALPLDHGESVEVLNYTEFELFHFGTYGNQIEECTEQIEHYTMTYSGYEKRKFCFEDREELYDLFYVKEQTVVDAVKGVEKEQKVVVFFYGAIPFWIEKR